MDKRMYNFMGMSLLAGSLFMGNPQPVLAAHIDFSHQQETATETQAAQVEPKEQQWY